MVCAQHATLHLLTRTLLSPRHQVRPLPLDGGSNHGRGSSHGKGGAQPWGGYSEAELLALAAAVERCSTHPIAKAIAKAAEAQRHGDRATQPGGKGKGGSAPGGGATAEEGSFVQEPGSGVTATVSGRRVSVGTVEWVTRGPGLQQQAAPAAEGPDGPAAAAVAAPEPPPVQAPQGAPSAADLQPGHILVYVGVDGQVAGASSKSMDAQCLAAMLGWLALVWHWHAGMAPLAPLRCK